MAISDGPGNEMQISVIIPTKNGAEQLRELLASLKTQSLQPDQVLVIDSSSSDSTTSVAREYGAELLEIEEREFDHGGTRSFGAQTARGDILIFLTQDALPADQNLLKNLVAPLRESSDICLSYARQLPSFNATDIAAHLRFFNYPEQPEIRAFDDRARLGLQCVFTSNSCSAYRKSSLKEIGYFETGLIFGEDSCAAGRLLENGLRIAYAADAKVYHSHDYSISDEFCRYFDIGVFHTNQKWLLDLYGGTGGRGLDYVRSGCSYLAKRRRYGLIGEFMVRVVFKFTAYRLGCMHRKLPTKLCAKMSLNSNWWDNGPDGPSVEQQEI